MDPVTGGTYYGTEKYSKLIFEKLTLRFRDILILYIAL